MSKVTELSKAYQYCQQLAQQHYENFPVASYLLPSQLRKPISVIYAFARTADDIADEGNENEQARLTALNDYQQQLIEIENKTFQGQNPLFTALNDVIRNHNLSVGLFKDLLIAFKQDVQQQRYQTESAVLDYCHYSANPIGRLVLQLYGMPSQQQLLQSDAICTALQLVNFTQDIQQDWQENNRIYLPMVELQQAGLSEQDLNDLNSSKYADIIRKQYEKSRTLFVQGFELASQLHGRLGWEIRTITLTGILVLKQLSSQDNQNLYSRPRLSKLQLFTHAIIALSPIVYRYYCQNYLNKVADDNALA